MFTRKHTIVSREVPLNLGQEKEVLIEDFRSKALKLLQESFNQRVLIQNPLFTITPTSQTMTILRLLFTLIGEDNYIDWTLHHMPWINPSASFTPDLQTGLKDHISIEVKLRKIITNPEQIVTAIKLNKIKAFIQNNEEIFAWLDANKTKFVYNTVIWNFAQIIKLTVRILDHFIRTQGNLMKLVKESLFTKVRGVRRWDSYKALLKKKTQSKLFKNRKIISNLVMLSKKFVGDCQNKEEAYGPNHGIDDDCFDEEVEIDEELVKAQLIREKKYHFRVYERQNCDVYY